MAAPAITAVAVAAQMDLAAPFSAAAAGYFFVAASALASRSTAALSLSASRDVESACAIAALSCISKAARTPAISGSSFLTSNGAIASSGRWVAGLHTQRGVEMWDAERVSPKTWALAAGLIGFGGVIVLGRNAGGRVSSGIPQSAGAA